MTDRLTTSDRPWLPQDAISEARARRVIAAQCPELRPVRLQLVGVGWDNTVFRVNHHWVFRFPRRDIAVALIDNERRILAAIASRLPLAIPVPTHLGEPSADYPWPFNGYRWIAGRTACSAHMDAPGRRAAAVPLAHFLCALHATPTDVARDHGVGDDQFGRLDLSRRLPQLDDRLSQAARLGLVDDPRAVFREVTANLPENWSARADTLVHGDLYARHVLVDADQQPCGIIDWGDVHLGDPAVDLAIAHGFLPADAAETFRHAYGDIAPVDDDTWRVARLKAAHHAVATWLYAHDVGDANLERESAAALGHILHR